MKPASQELKRLNAKRRPDAPRIQYVAHDGARAQTRRLRQMAKAGLGYICGSCGVLHEWSVPVVVGGDGQLRCEVGAVRGVKGKA